MKASVFVSYSHADAPLVAPVVKLLRINQSLVFQDVDDIRPGKRWRGEIARGLSEAHIVVVFWCDHASRSDEVSVEWRAALQQEKDVLPLLLDGTPLPAELQEFQWIDFRGLVGASHVAERASAVPAPAEPLRAPRRSCLPVIVAATLVVALIVAAAMYFMVLSSGPEPGPLPLPDPGPGPGPVILSPPSLLSALSRMAAAAAAAIAAAIAAVFFWRGRKRRRHPPVEVRAVGADTTERWMANEIAAEILRRRASGR